MEGVKNMKDLEAENENRSMMVSDSGDSKADKSKELNDSMSIQEQAQDEYESKIHSLGGSQ